MRSLRTMAALLPLLLAMVCWTALPVLAQDAAVADAKHHKVEFENDQVRVLRYTIAPGEKTELHEHPNNVQVMLTDHNAKVTVGDKTTEAHGKAGTAVWRTPVTHIVENIGDQPIVGLLIEPKKPASTLPSAALDPTKVDPKTTKVEFENDQVRVIRYHYPAHYKAPMHAHGDNVQVMLTDHDIKTTTQDGNSAEAHAKAGQVFWRKAVVHEGENIGDKDFEGIHVEMKGAATAAHAQN